MLLRPFIFYLLLLVCQASFSANIALADSLDVQLPNDSIKLVKKTFKNKLKHALSQLDNTDSLYIEPNHYNYTAMLQNTNFYQSYSLSSPTENGETQSLTLNPRTAFKVGPYFGWRWLFLGYTFNVGRPSQAGKTTEFALSLYSAKVGVDYVAIRSTGDFTFLRISGFQSTKTPLIRGQHFNGMASHTKKINIYYIFNSKHFSYPAAFNQSTVQRRSAGSWKIGLRYDNQRIDFDGTQLPSSMRDELTSGLQSVKLNQTNYSVSFGYSYNWVFARNWLLAGSFSPALGYTHSKGETFTGRKLVQSLKNNLTNLDCITRIGLVYNNTRWFAGASLIHYFYNYHQKTYAFSNSVLYANFYVGFNFIKRKKYQKHGQSIF